MAFAATASLYRVPSPPDLDAAGPGWGLIAVPLALLPLRGLGRAAAAGWILGGGLGLAYAHAWLVEVLPRVGPITTGRAAAALVGTALLLTAARFVLLALAGRARHPAAVAVAGALALTAAEHVAARAAPWLAPVTLGWAAANLPGGGGVLSVGGTSLVCLLVALFAGACVRGAPAVALVAAGAWGLAALAQPTRADGPAGLPVTGAQPGPPPDVPDWHDAQLAALLRAERGADRGIVAWPEGAYPWRERATEAWTPARLDPPEGHWRVFGAQLRGRGGRYRNVVAVQAPGAARVTLRDKEVLAPLRETALVEAASAGPLVRDVAGRRLALPICYELLDEGLFVGESFDAVLSVSSDGFDPTGSVARILARAARLRAATSGVPVVRVSDTAHSVAFDGSGRLLAWAPPGAGLLRVTIR